MEKGSGDNRLTKVEFGSGDAEMNLCKFCKKEIIDGLMMYEDKIPVAHYSCFRKSKGKGEQ